LPRFLARSSAWTLSITLLLGGAAAGAQPAAPSSVTLFGLVDTGIEWVDSIGADRDTVLRMPTLTGSLPSRFGLRGTEALGSGLSAVFTLESGFGIDQGTLTQGGRMFGRQAWVGLSGPWGTVSAGRQYTMLFWSVLDTDVLGPNVYSSASLDSYIPNARADNALAWRATFSALTLGASVSLGRDAVNAGPSPAGTNCAGESATDRKACRQWSALIKLDRPAWGAALAIDEIRGGPGAFAGLASSALRDRRTAANGYLRRGAHKIALGLIRRDNDASSATPKSDLWYLGGSRAHGAWLLDVELFRLRFKGSPDAAQLAAARVAYAFSRRGSAYVTGGRIDNDGTLALSVSGGGAGTNPVAGGAQNGVMLGLRHSF